MLKMILFVVLAGIVATVLWQHFRYVNIRRDILEDRQPILYSADAFHAVTFVKVTADQSALEELRKLKDVVTAHSDATVVYAGLGTPIRTSSQVPSDWNALMLVQYPSRSAFDVMAANHEYQQLLARWDNNYTHGAQRPVLSNLMAPIGLLAMRISDLVRRVPSAFPFVPADPETTPGITQRAATFARLEQFRDINDKAVVVFNLIRPGGEEQQKANNSYVRSMFGAMAEGAYGPAHEGRAVTVEGDADFRRFAAIYYPGVDFMLEMVASTFFNRITGNKQVGDTLVVATVPVLSRL